MCHSVLREHPDRNFNDDRVYVEAGTVVRREVRLVIGVLCVVRYSGDTGVERPRWEVQRIERGTKIDPKRIFDGAGEHTNTVVEMVDPLVRQVGLIRHSTRADVARNGEESLAVAEFQGSRGAPFRCRFTGKDCRKLKPSEPGPSSAVIGASRWLAPKAVAAKAKTQSDVMMEMRLMGSSRVFGWAALLQGGSTRGFGPAARVDFSSVPKNWGPVTWTPLGAHVWFPAPSEIAPIFE